MLLSTNIYVYELPPQKLSLMRFKFGISEFTIMMRIENLKSVLRSLKFEFRFTIFF